MIIKISLKQFFDITKISYNEDVFDLVYHDYNHYTKDEIIDALPPKYSYLAERLENDPEKLYFDGLTSAINQADETALIDKAYQAQVNALEAKIDALANLINLVQDNAINKISLDWQNEQIALDLNPANALQAIVSIISGEGYFDIATPADLMESIPTKSKTEAITSHLHYLLDGKLIADIYGERWTPDFDWQVNYWQIDDAILAENIADVLLEIDAKKDDKAFLAENITPKLNAISDLLALYSTKKDLNQAILRNIKSILAILK